MEKVEEIDGRSVIDALVAFPTCPIDRPLQRRRVPAKKLSEKNLIRRMYERRSWYDGA